MPDLEEALTELETHQTQLDMDGVMVGVSRQALDILITAALNPDFLSALDTARAANEALMVERTILIETKREQLAQAQSNLTAAQERIAELEGALKPFALISSEGVVPNGYEGFATITTSAEYFHRADAILSPAVKEPK